ncbi:MAG: hypothetical protein ACRBBP_10465 [Bdellovibrionales bacterium]
MKAIIILLTAAMVFTGCSSSSGGKSSTTNPVDPNSGTTQPGRVGGSGSTTTPTTPGVTPYAYGENRVFPVGAIELAFDTSTNGGVYSEGEMRLQSQAGSLNCVVPVGTYELLTSLPGTEKVVVHNYGGITLSATGPVLFTALLENSLSRQNPDGEWVMHAVLKVQSVGGVTCSNPVPLSFGMPTS